MATTTLRVPDELKNRVQQLARKAGKTAHAFMVEAIEETVRLREVRAGAIAEADARFEELLKSGSGLDWRELRKYVSDRAARRKATAPRKRSWRK